MAVLAMACGLASACSSSTDMMTQFGFTPAALKIAGESDAAGLVDPEDESAELAAALPSAARQGDDTAPQAAQDASEPVLPGKAEALAAGDNSDQAKDGFFSSLFSRQPENDESGPGAPVEPDRLASADTPAAGGADGDAARKPVVAAAEGDESASGGFFASLFSSAPEEGKTKSRKLIKPAMAAGKEASRTPESGQQVARAPEDDEATSDASRAQDQRGFLMALFSPAGDSPARQSEIVGAMEDKIEGDAAQRTPVPVSFSGEVLPGVRDSEQLFEVVRKSNIDDISDVDLYEGENLYQVASAAGLARLAPHGLLKQRDDVDVACFKPNLVRMLKTIERHFGKRVVVTSGYRSPEHNRRVRGARRSQHMYCAAADIQLAGVSKWELARFVRSLPGRGGVGTYCHTRSVHVDVGPERDWNWRCRG